MNGSFEIRILDIINCFKNPLIWYIIRIPLHYKILGVILSQLYF